MRRGAPNYEKSDGEGVGGGDNILFYFILYFVWATNEQQGLQGQLGGECEPWCDKKI